MFFTHGEEDAILKFQYTERLLKKRYVFIDCENAGLLKNKNVIAICCDSAKILGQYSVNECKSKFYIGFYNAIEYSDGNANPYFLNIMYAAYSDAFFEALTLAHTNKWTANKFVFRLKRMIENKITVAILQADNKKLGSVSQFNFYINSVNSLVCLGDGNQAIYS